MEQGKPAKSGLVIKLSCETVEKLQKTPITDEYHQRSLDQQTSSIQDSLEDNKTISIQNNPSVQSDNKNDTEMKLLENHKETESVSGWGDYAPYITYEGDNAIYTDPNIGTQYIWDPTCSVWSPKVSETPEVSGRVYSYEDDTHIYTEPDGSKCFWDDQKKAWIPKVDEDFIAMYQMSYGFVDNTSKEEKTEEAKPDDSKGLKRKVVEPPKWFDASEENNTKVYVSNLPEDLTEEEFVDFMQKCGLVMRDPNTQKMKIKLYMDKENNCFKGDALCTYIKIESVELALKLLDGSDYKGKTISVQRAKFQMKGEYNPALKPKKKKKKELEKLKRMQEKLFDWRPEKIAGERNKSERIVIIKNLFHPSDFDKDVQLILDYQQDLREECTKCGDVRKIVLYDRHPEGVAQVTMKEPEEADAVVALINGRWFGKRMLSAEIWDGRTKYRIAETDADMSKRVDKWEKFLEGAEVEQAKEVDEKSVAEENKNKQSGDITQVQDNPVEREEENSLTENP